MTPMYVGVHSIYISKFYGSIIATCLHMTFWILVFTVYSSLQKEMIARLIWLLNLCHFVYYNLVS